MSRCASAAAPIVHLFRFPRITINHGIVLFGSAESERDIQFEATIRTFPQHPVKLITAGPRERSLSHRPIIGLAGG